MARMFPEQFPRAPNPDDPEFEVYSTLRLLPDSYSVFYSKKFKGGRRSKEECEVDFLIFDGHQSLLCCEVKGGLIEYRGDDDAWYQNGKRLARSPDRQASAATHAVIDFLGESAQSINIGWCLCFPNCVLPAHLQPPAGLPRSVLLDQSHLTDVETAINTVGSYLADRFARPGIEPRRAELVVQKLNRGIGFIQKIGTRVARDFQQIIQATDEQLRVLDDLQANRWIAVRGVAGSGKTLIAKEFAERLASDGQSVLLLFYNRMIANSVRYGLPRDSSIECSTFHSFARKIIEDEDPDWWKTQSRNDSEFWEDEVPLKLWETQINEDRTFDAVIIDEGQDFKPDWFECLEQLLADPVEGRFVVFYDEFQDIFDRWEDTPWDKGNVLRKVLTRNCRNTKLITEYLGQIHDQEIETFDQSPTGQAVVEEVFDSVDDEREWLSRKLTSLIKNGIEPAQIVLIIHGPKELSALGNLPCIGNVAIESIGRTFRDRSDAIRYTTIDQFKGLEADIVFVLGMSETADDSSHRFYTEASRARIMLFVSRIRG